MAEQRAGILTFLHNDNYGSLMQAWALQEQLRSLGIDAVHLDYRPDTQEKIRNLLRCGNSPALILDGVAKRRVKQAHPEAQRKTEALRAFREAHLRTTNACRNGAALAEAASAMDLLIAGSDQVWSPEWLNERYFLTFGKPGQRKIAYAASLGVSEAPKGRKARLMRRWIGGFDAISVREEAGAEIVRQMTGREAAVMPDPVLLMERPQWTAVMDAPDRRPPYLLAYFIGQKPDYWKTARELAKAKGLALAAFPVREEAWREAGDSCIADVTPGSWLSAFAGAAYILTDSFHGTAFACMFGKPFTAMKRYGAGDRNSKNSRIEQLLGRLGLPWENAVPDADTASRLAALRKEGLEWLSGSLNG